MRQRERRERSERTRRQRRTRQKEHDIASADTTEANNERHSGNLGKCLSHNELQRFVLFLGRKTANRDKPLQKKSLAQALKRFLQQSGKCGKMDFWKSKVLKSSIYRIMFCLPGIWENVKFIFFFALPAKIYHQIYITIKQHTYVDFFPHAPINTIFSPCFFHIPGFPIL